jgi:hypothetical protein
MQYHLTTSIFAAICACSFGQIAFGQTAISTSTSSSSTSTSTTVGPNGFSGSARMGALPAFAMQTVTGAPYSGEEVSDQVQTLADGTHITQSSIPTKVYRDSLGRTRTERPLFRGMMMAGRVSDPPIIVEIMDPVAQLKYTFDPVNKVAHRQQAPAGQPAPQNVAGRTVARSGVMGAVVGGGGGLGAPVGGVLSLAPMAAMPVPQMSGTEATRPQITNERLGTQTVEGVLAEGTRHTTTWPVGAQGNDRPISMVSENWFSPELKVMILSKTTDPRSGEHTQKLTNISRGEPSSSLFQPPPEYTLVDEAGEFTIKWGSQQ